MDFFIGSISFYNESKNKRSKNSKTIVLKFGQKNYMKNV